MTTSFWNGERAVVILFISRIVVSAPYSLLCELLALFVLSLYALLIEILAEASDSLSQLSARAGASSGIFLGAVTIPAVIASKLVQQSRGYLLREIELKDLEYLKLQFWAASACCFCVLVYLYLVTRHSHIKKNSFNGRVQCGTKFSISCILFYAALCGSSLVKISFFEFSSSLNLLWVLFHGLSSVKLIQHLLTTFTSCASIGEALLVTSGLIPYFGDMFACTLSKILKHLISSELSSTHFRMKRSEISTIIQGTLLGLLLLPVMLKFIFEFLERSTRRISSEHKKYNDIARSVVFFTSLTLVMAVVVPWWMQFVQDFMVHPVLFLMRPMFNRVVMFVFSEPLKRLSLCIYWAGLISVSVLRFYNISKNSKIERILLRKYYHLLAVLMFVPALIYQPKFLDLAFGAALAVFLVLEIIRVWRIWPLGQLIHQFMSAFTDHRDSDILIVSHFSLLLGCALPIWMSSGYNDRPLAPFAGILSLGIGDTMASMVGYKYGALRWSKTGSITFEKTVEGTAAGITSVLAACSVLLPTFASTGFMVSEHWLSLLLAVTVSGLLEAYTAQLDNAFIPLVFYSHLCL